MKKILIYSFLTAGLIGILGAGAASAEGWFGMGGDKEVIFQKKAEFLGISADELKNAWAEGKNFNQIAEEYGIDREQLRERARELKQENMESHFQAMVDSGVITQEQANERLQTIQDKFEDGQMRKGFYHGFGKCFK